VIKGGTIKISNGKPKCLALDGEMKLLFVGTEEGLLLFYNVSISGKQDYQSALSLVHIIPFDH